MSKAWSKIANTVAELLPAPTTSSRVVPLMHGGRYEHAPERTVCPPDVGVNELAIVVPHDFIRDERPGRKTQEGENGDVDRCGYQTVHRMEPCQRQPGHLCVAVMNRVSRPQPPRVLEPVPPKHDAKSPINMAMTRRSERFPDRPNPQRRRPRVNIC